MVSVTAPTTTPDDILERICRENIAVYRESQGRLQEDVSQESQVARDYRGRLVYELLQNADDALVGVDTTEDRALFRLTDTELWVANTGRPSPTHTEGGVAGRELRRHLRCPALDPANRSVRPPSHGGR